VNGYMRGIVTVYDARTRAVDAEENVAQPASFRPAFSRDGKLLYTVEGSDFVVREPGRKGWAVSKRVPLGFDPRIGVRPSTIALAPDGSEAALAEGGSLVRMSRCVAYAGPGRLRWSRWDPDVVETRFVADAGPPPAPLPFAILAESADGDAWLVARAPRKDGAKVVDLEVVDARSGASLSTFSLEPEKRGFGVVQAEFTPDGRHVLVVEDLFRLSVREARTGRLVQTIREYEGDRLIGFATSPDGSRLLTGGRRTVEGKDDRALLLWKRRGS
jgi:hypothetical protein